ncbi:MAG: hypothetical protein IPP64_11670 [Bacteroidetes bacterium]|nr:hypothetical protein [Bacteroidota bacterium]
MKIYKKEIIAGATIVAIAWVVVDHTDKKAKRYAEAKLQEFIDAYIGARGFNLYKHTQPDTVGVMITFNTDDCPTEEFEV